MPEIVVKRDGREEPFLSFKIDDAIKKAYTSVGQLHNPNILNKVLEKLHGDKINIEDIQDTIEEVLYDMGTYKVLKSFIQYRQIHKLQRDITNSDKENATFIDCNETIDEYIGKTDWRIHANSNTSYSHGGLINNTAGKVIANYWLDKVLTKKQGLLHREGFIHVHDLDCLSPYCFTGDTKVRLADGTSKSFLELVEEWNKDNNYVELYSADITTGNITIGYGYLPRLVKKNSELVKVLLSNNKEVVCTPDHKFLLDNLIYKEAKDLVKNDILKSIEKEEIQVIDVIELDYKEDVYCLTVSKYHNFALDAGIIVKNCAGWSLRALLDEGFNGVRGRAESKAPKHLREAVLQMANFIGILQSEWAGAQAFSSFDTYLAPYLFRDQLTDEDLYKAIRSFVYNLNVPSRWSQCVPDTYKCLKADGKWVSHKDLKVGDKIYVFDIDTNTIKTDTIQKVNLFDKPEVMHRYTVKDSTMNPKEFHFDVTDQHRVIIKHTEKGNYQLIESNKIDIKEPTSFADRYYIPTYEDNVLNYEEVISKEEVECDYNQVWCPTTTTGTFICQTDEGNVFITGNSPFSNITLDITVPEDLKEQIPTREQHHIFSDITPDHPDYEKLTKLAKERGRDKLVDMTYKDFLPEMERIVIAYYKVMTEGDAKGRPFTFPIPTINITEEFKWDSEVSDAIFENAALRGSSYFQNFIGSQYIKDENGNLVPNEKAYKPGHIRSMCPMTPDTEVLVRSSTGVTILSIGEIVKNMRKGTEYEVFYKGMWNKAKPVQVPATDVYEITFSNGVKVKFGENHLQPILMDKELVNFKTKDLKVGMWVPFNKDVMFNNPNNLKGSFLLGAIVGIYLGDGSIDNSGIAFSLSATETKEEASKMVYNLFGDILGYRITTSFRDKLKTLRVGSNSYDVIKRFIKGDNALNKDMSKIVFNQSLEFRQGLLYGLLLTDGCLKQNKYYTSSKALADSIIKLAHTIGVTIFISYVDDRTVEDGKLSNNINYQLTIINRPKNYSNLYKLCNDTREPDFNYFSIRKIEKVNYTGDYLYCVEVDNLAHHFTLASGLVTSNCRLMLDLRELLKRGGGLFGSAEMTGGVSNATINLAILGYLHKGDKEALFKHLDEILEECKDISERRRKAVIEWYERGLYPYTKRYLPNFNHHFSIIGANGCNELIRNFTNDKEDIGTEYGQQLAYDITEYIREKIKVFQEETGNLYNFEASPAEGANHRFAKESLKRHPDIITAGTTQQPYFTNSTQLPANYTDDIFKALDLQDKLQCQYTGGTVLHVYMDNYLPNKNSAKLLVKKILTNYTLPYITLTPTNRICPKHGLVEYDNDGYCPECDKEILDKHKDELI